MKRKKTMDLSEVFFRIYLIRNIALLTLIFIAGVGVGYWWGK